MEEYKATLKKGDFIKCNDSEDCIHTMCELMKAGVDTEFCYSRDGHKGFWLEVTKVAEEEE